MGKRDEPPVDLALRRRERRAGRERRGRLEEASSIDVYRPARDGALQRIDVQPVDRRDVVQRVLERWKEAGARRRKLRVVERSACPQESKDEQRRHSQARVVP